MPPSPRPDDLLTAILLWSGDALLSFALDGTIQAWSRGAAEVYGYSDAEIKGQPFALLLPLEEKAVPIELLRGATPGEWAPSESADRLHKDGSKIRVRVQRTAVRNEQGEPIAILEKGRPLAKHCKSPARVPLGERQARTSLEQMPAILWTTDRSLRITSNWGCGWGTAKVKSGELVGRTVDGYLKCGDLHGAPFAHHVEALRGVTAHFEYRHQNRDFDVHVGPLRAADGEIVGRIGVGLDITVRKRNEEQALYQATHDALTGLANYGEFASALEREVKRADRSNHPFAVLLLDLDDLKRINDRLGHLVGNRALQRLAEVMNRHCRSTDLAARYGGDEFAVLLIDADPAMAQQIAGRVENELRKNREGPAFTVSIGIGVYPDDGRTAQELLEAADQQLYKRKKGSRNEGTVAG